MSPSKMLQKMSSTKMLPKMSSPKMMLKIINSSKEDAHYVQVFFVAQLTPSK